MATEVVMPQMGYDMTEGTVVRWICHEGDEVKRGDVIAEIETDKAIIEMEAEATGLIRKILVSEGVKVPVGHSIAYIGNPEESIPEPIESAASLGSTSSVTESVKPRTMPREPQATIGLESKEVRISPVARRIAEEEGVDINQVVGSGPGGRITKEDVLGHMRRALDAITPETRDASWPTTPQRQSGTTRIELSRMGQTIARRTQQAKREIPHYYVAMSVDMTRSLELRSEINEALDNEVHISVNDIIIKACTLSLIKFPAFNSVFSEDHLQVAPHVNIGIAIALPEGLIVPAILGCENKSLIEIARDSKSLGERVRSGRLRQDEYTAATFSISNLGMYGVDSFAAIIVAPQSAVLAVGAVRSQPVVREGDIVIRQMMDATISADHRTTNGADGAEFIGEVKRLLEHPAELILPAPV